MLSARLWTWNVTDPLAVLEVIWHSVTVISVDKIIALDKFITVWEQAESLEDVEKKLGIPRKNASDRAFSLLIKKGIPLRNRTPCLLYTSPSPRDS